METKLDDFPPGALAADKEQNLSEWMDMMKSTHADDEIEAYRQQAASLKHQIQWMDFQLQEANLREAALLSRPQPEAAPVNFDTAPAGCVFCEKAQPVRIRSASLLRRKAFSADGSPLVWRPTTVSSGNLAAAGEDKDYEVVTPDTCVSSRDVDELKRNASNEIALYQERLNNLKNQVNWHKQKCTEVAKTNAVLQRKLLDLLSQGSRTQEVSTQKGRYRSFTNSDIILSGDCGLSSPAASPSGDDNSHDERPPPLAKRFARSSTERSASELEGRHEPRIDELERRDSHLQKKEDDAATGDVFLRLAKKESEIEALSANYQHRLDRVQKELDATHAELQEMRRRCWEVTSKNPDNETPKSDALTNLKKLIRSYLTAAKANNDAMTKGLLPALCAHSDMTPEDTAKVLQGVTPLPRF